MRTRVLLRFILVVIPTVGLMFIWLAFLPHQGQAIAPAVLAPLADEQAPPPAPMPDPQWLQIVRSREVASGSAPQAAQPTINLNLTDGYMTGRAPSPLMVTITVLDQGQEIGVIETMPELDAGGFYYTAWVGWYNLEPGYELDVTQGAAFISMTVPILTGLAYPQTELLSGAAPANAGLLAYLLPNDAPDEVYTHTATASAGGTYQMDWSATADLRPQDSGYLLYAQDEVRQTYVRFVAPFLRAQVGGYDLFGMAAPTGEVDIWVEAEAGGILFTNTYYANSDGSFFAPLCYYYWDYICFSLAPTQRLFALAGGQTFSLTIITLTAQADFAAGEVWGQAPPDQPVEVLRFRGPADSGSNIPWDGTPLSRVVVTATAQGEYAAVLPLQAGNYGAARMTTAQGNQLYTRYALPYLYARLGRPEEYYYYWQRMWGNVIAANTPITVEVQGPSGYLKDWYTLVSDWDGHFQDSYSSQDSLSLESGDRITLTTGPEVQLSLLLPVLTAGADPETDIVSGQTEPFAQVVVYLDYRALTVTAGVDGLYGADFSSLGGLAEFDRGSVKWTSPEGYHVARFFDVYPESICPPRLTTALIGGNEVSLEGSYYCGATIFRLRDAQGGIKYEHTFDYPLEFLYLYDDDWQPVFIAAGDQIEIAAEGQTRTYVVPTLTAQLDAPVDRAYGQAPPAAVVEVQIPEQEFPVLTTTASAQGVYSFDLAGLVDLQPGSFLGVTLVGSPRYYVYAVLPVLTVHLYSYNVSGRLQPYTPYTITLHTPFTVTEAMNGAADARGDFSLGLYPPPGELPHFQPGDRLEMQTPTRFWQLILPRLTASVDASTGVVSGMVPPGSQLAVNLGARFNDWPYFQYLTEIVTATASGVYSATFPIPVNDSYLQGYISHFTGEDMRTNLDFTTPFWEVTLGSNWVRGRAPMFGAPVTVTLLARDGSYSQVITDTDMSNSSYFSVEFARAVHPGDRLKLQTSDGQVSEFTVPYLSAAHDYASRVLEGQVPLDGEVIAEIPAFFGTVQRNIRRGADGCFGIDLSDLRTPVGQQGAVIYTDRYGNRVICWFMIRGYPGYLPLIRLLAVP